MKNNKFQWVDDSVKIDFDVADWIRKDMKQLEEAT